MNYAGRNVERKSVGRMPARGAKQR